MPGSARGNGDPMAIRETKQSRDRRRAARERNRLRLVGRKPFVTGMLGEDIWIEADFARTQKTLQPRAQAVC